MARHGEVGHGMVGRGLVRHGSFFLQGDCYE